MKTFPTRIGRVRMKSGGADLRILHPRETEVYGRMRRDFDNLLRKIPSHKLAGFAFVAWSHDGYAWPRLQIVGGPVPQHLAPSYVKDVLLGEVVCGDVIREIAPPKPEDDGA